MQKRKTLARSTRRSVGRSVGRSLGRASIAIGSMLIVSSLMAGNADVVDVEIIALGGDKYRINTAVKHDDTGWEHYANRWDVVAPDGTILGSRILAHPHENEQPFTRSLTLSIPANISSVTIQANDLVHGLGGKTITVEVKH